MGSKIGVRANELQLPWLKAKGLEVTLGRVVREWEEEPGPTPMPDISTFREWDKKLLRRYKPFYLPFCDLCCLCTFGKCDLSRGKRGGCGIDMGAQLSRIVLLSCAIGTSTHCGHARHILDELIEKYGRNHPLDVGGENVYLEAPIIRLVTGIKPRTLGDLEDVLDYCETEIVHLLSCVQTGQEGDNLDFESKVLHAGMIDHVALETADIAQISAYGFPKADPEARLVELGMGVIDRSKPVILVIGHNVPPSIGVADFLAREGLEDQVELCGICCTAIDITRYSRKAKIVGPISFQLRFVRSGVADVIMVDEQCIRADILREAQKVNAILITTHYKSLHGLPDRTKDPVEHIVKELVEGKLPGVAILDPEKAGEVAVRVAMQVAPRRRKMGIIPPEEKVVEEARRCNSCFYCVRACPNTLPIPQALSEAGKGNLEPLSELYEPCVGCGRCEQEGICPVGIKPHTLIVGAHRLKTAEEKFKMRTGRGAIQDVEIRRAGQPIVMGDIPGVVAFVGCSNFPGSWKEVARMAEEFARRKYIIGTTGCSAMAIGMYRDENGQSLYETYPGVFDAGGLVNCGSCVSNSHIAGAAIKIANIFAKRKLRANYEEIADYIHNRVGAVGVAWGAYSQKASAIASGFWRLGVPVIVGPHGSKYRRALLGRKEDHEVWKVIDARTGKEAYVGPVPEHLFLMAETVEEAMVSIPKLCMRANDTGKGRSIKLNHYIDLHRKLFGELPDDLHFFVRTVADIPATMKDEVLTFLKERGWKEFENPNPDPTLVPRLVRVKEG